MDDQEFDKHIRKKVGNYEVSGFDPAALSGLHHQLASEKVWPWYSRYKSELIISSILLLSTLAILFSQWSVKTRVQVLEEEILLLQKQNERAYNLQNEFDIPNSIHTDTIVEIREAPLNLILIQKIAALEQRLSRASSYNEVYSEKNNQKYPTYFLKSNHTSLESEGLQNSKTSRLVPHERRSESIHASQDSAVQLMAGSKLKLTAKGIRALEKHYQHGIGIRFGPTLEISHGIYHEGNGRFDIGGGLIGDFILSPSFSLETGVKYAHRFYEISGEEMLFEKQLPGTDNNLGALVNADVDSWVLEIPLNIKYRYPVSPKSQVIAGFGYSSLIYTKQIFEYEYEFEANSPVRLGTSYEETTGKVSPGSLNIMLGINSELKNSKNLEASLFYQYGLGNMGAEKNRANFIGLRSVYWFTIR